VSLKNIIWLGPVVFLIHDLEEVFWTQPWIEKNRFLFEDTQFERVIEAMGYQPAKFGLVVALITILFGIISYFATRQIQAGLSMNLYVSTLLILFVNVFTHAGQIGNVYPRRRHSGIGRPALYGDSVSNIESPPPVDQDNLENQSVYVRWNACRHLWADDGGVTEEPTFRRGVEAVMSTSPRGLVAWATWRS